MATTGNRITASGSGNFEHTDNVHIVHGPKNTWLGCVKDTDGNWKLWHFDQPVPGTPGDVGGWSVAVGGDSLPQSADARPTMHWDAANNILHWVKQDNSVELYRQLNWDPVLEEFSTVFSGAPVNVSTDEQKIVPISDGAGRVFVVYRNGSAWKCRYRDPVGGGDSDPWKDGNQNITPDFLTGGSFGYTHGWRFIDQNGDPGICIAGPFQPLAGGLTGHVFAYRLDSALENGPWTAETINLLGQVDGHPTMAVAKLPGDIGSTVLFGEKGAATTHLYRRSALGVWGGDFGLPGGGTRRQMSVDETNGIVRLYRSSGQTAMHYFEADLADATPAWTGPIDYVEDDGVTTFGDNHSVPSHACDSVTGWMAFGTRGACWYRHQTIAGGEASLAIQSAVHAHTADNLDLELPPVLVIADALHGHTADSPTLTPLFTLSIDDAAHGHTADALELAVAFSLNVAGAVHAHAADNLELAAAYVLVIADAHHTHMGDNVTLEPAGSLGIADALHGHTADNLELVPAYTLAIAGAVHAHAADGLELVTGDILAIADGAHGHTADALELVQQSGLVIADAVHGHTADPLTMIPAAFLVIDSAGHIHVADRCDVFEGVVSIQTPEARRLVLAPDSRAILIRADSRRLLIQ